MKEVPQDWELPQPDADAMAMQRKDPAAAMPEAEVRQQSMMFRQGWGLLPTIWLNWRLR